jgi:hypothetical protein
LEHVEDQIDRSDTKAQVILAADAILLGWFGTLNSNVLPALLAGNSAPSTRATSLLVASVFTALFLSVVSGLVVIWPRSGSSRGTSLVYFGSIARRGESEFIATFLRQSRMEVTQTVLAGVHAEARIARRKYRWVSVSVAFLLVTLVLVAGLGVLRIALP